MASVKYFAVVGVAIFAICICHVTQVACLPPITPGAANKSVLGDYEIAQICNISGSDDLCPTAGAADAKCQAISQAVGNCVNPACAAVGVCKFSVNTPVQHPTVPGTACVTKNVPAEYGVIFPCAMGNLVIAVPLSEIGGPSKNPAPAGNNITAPAGNNLAPAGNNPAPAGNNPAPAGNNTAPAGNNPAPAGIKTTGKTTTNKP